MPRHRTVRSDTALPARTQMPPIVMPYRLLEMVTLKAATSGLSRTAWVRRALAREVGYTFEAKQNKT